MKRNIIYSILFISYLTLFSSCTEKINLELNDSFTRLVLEGNITTDSVKQQIKLTKSTSYFYNQQPPALVGADVKVTDGNMIYSYSETPANSGIYISDNAFAGKSGNNYQLLINNVDLGDNTGIKNYKAEENMKNVLTIDSLYAIEANIFGIKGYRVFGFVQEPPTAGDFYLWRYYVNGKLITDTLNETTFASDQLVNGNYLTNFEMGFITDGNSGDTLTVETNSITENYFNFIITFFIETQWSGGGFGGPPANIQTNINNGAVGYFSTQARSRIQTILP